MFGRKKQQEGSVRVDECGCILRYSNGKWRVERRCWKHLALGTDTEEPAIYRRARHGNFDRRV